MSVADDIAPIAVTDPDGGEVTLASLWADKPVVLVFIRHFG